MSIQIEVDGEIYSGSGVAEAWGKWESVPLSPKGASLNSKYRGEAVVIDLEEHGYVFALWTMYTGRPDRRGIGLYKLGLDDPRYVSPDQMREKRSAIARLREYAADKQEFEAGGKDLPVLVRFTKLSDRHSVELIGPDNIEMVFGAGARILSASVGVTDEALSPSRISDLLPWVDDNSEPFFPIGETPQESLVGDLRIDDFKRRME